MVTKFTCLKKNVSPAKGHLHGEKNGKKCGMILNIAVKDAKEKRNLVPFRYFIIGYCSLSAAFKSPYLTVS